MPAASFAVVATIKNVSADNVSRSSFKEGLENLVSYLKFFTFLALVGGAAYYFYHQKKSDALGNAASVKISQESGEMTPSESTPALKPSELVNATVQRDLSPLLADLNDSAQELSPEFLSTEQKIQEQITYAGPLLSAWNGASAVCVEIRKIADYRKVASKSLFSPQPSAQSSSKVPVSKQQRANEIKNQEFFLKLAQQKWRNTVLMSKKRVEYLQRQVIAAEALAEGTAKK